MGQAGPLLRLSVDPEGQGEGCEDQVGHSGPLDTQGAVCPLLTGSACTHPRGTSHVRPRTSVAQSDHRVTLTGAKAQVCCGWGSPHSPEAVSYNLLLAVWPRAQRIGLLVCS